MDDSKLGLGGANIKKVIPIPCTGNFFKDWLEVIKPLHHLTNREMDLLAAFLKKRYELEKIVPDKDMIDALLMSKKVKKAIRESLNFSTPYFEKVLITYRSGNILLKDPDIKSGRINPLMIPPLKEEDKVIVVLFVFDNPNDG